MHWSSLFASRCLPPVCLCTRVCTLVRQASRWLRVACFQARLAEFMGTEESIIYSYDLATIPSVLPAFANAKDLIVCDEVRAVGGVARSLLRLLLIVDCCRSVRLHAD